MTQEDIKLLLKDLCARQPYGVVAQVTYKDSEGWKTEDRKVLGVYTDGQVYVDCVYTNIENTKPYLRPMSSMTEEEKHELLRFGTVSLDKDSNAIDVCCVGFWNHAKVQDYLNSIHIDYRGLIPKGLAIEAPDGMYN